MTWNHKRDACDPGCPGWALFDEGTDREAVQRCDECNRFEDDDAAVRHVAVRADAIDRLLITLADLATRCKGAHVELMPDGSVCFRAEGRRRFGGGDDFVAAVADLRKEVADL